MNTSNKYIEAKLEDAALDPLYGLWHEDTDKNLTFHNSSKISMVLGIGCLSNLHFF